MIGASFISLYIMPVQAKAEVFVQESNLSSSENKLAAVFETNRYGVVSIVDIKLRGQAGGGGSVDTPEGNGTGVVFDNQSNVITNWHVLQTSLKEDPKPGSLIARVTLLRPDNTQQTFNATLVGADKARDLAVIRIEGIAENLLRPLSFSQATPKVGSLAISIGNPFGFFQSFSVGVVSGLGREIKSQTGSLIPNGIQHDAMLNPGSSGGPLLNSSGQVIGLNTAIFTPTGFSVGINFAIASDVLLRVIPQLIQNGRVARGSLGLSLAEDDLAKKLGVTQGVMIKSVADGGPAARVGLAGLRRGLSGVIPGDALLEVEGRSIGSEADLVSTLDQFSVGDKVNVKAEVTNEQGKREVKTIELTLQEDKN